jgi:hypothetical protein
MRPGLTRTALAGIVAALALAASAGAAAIVLKSYSFSTLSDVKNMKHTNGRHCTKSWALHRAFGISVGRNTVQCTYRTTVAGPSLDISATGRMLSSTPKAIRTKTFISVSVRHGSNSGYELQVFPKRKEYKLFRRFKGGRALVDNGSGTLSRINGVGQRNKLRLRAFAPGSGDPGELKIYINDKRVLGMDGGISKTPNFTGMEGQDSTVSVGQAFGASGSIRGAKVTFDAIVVRTRNPFG